MGQEKLNSMTALSKRLWDIKYSTYKICNKIFTEFHKIIQMSVLKKKIKKGCGRGYKTCLLQNLLLIPWKRTPFSFSFPGRNVLWVTECYRANVPMEQRVFLAKVRAVAKGKKKKKAAQRLTWFHCVRRMLKQSLCINLLSKKYEVWKRRKS